MYKIIFMALIAIAATSPAYGYKVYGLGNSSCGEWLNERKSEQVSLSEAAMEHWVLGFLGGAGWRGYALKNSGTQAVTAWLDQYCAENPLESMADATANLARELNRLDAK